MKRLFLLVPLHAALAHLLAGQVPDSAAVRARQIAWLQSVLTPENVARGYRYSVTEQACTLRIRTDVELTSGLWGIDSAIVPLRQVDARKTADSSFGELVVLRTINGRQVISEISRRPTTGKPNSYISNSTLLHMASPDIARPVATSFASLATWCGATPISILPPADTTGRASRTPPTRPLPGIPRGMARCTPTR